MKKFFLLIALMSVSLGLSAKNYNLSNFSSIRASGAYDITLTKSDTYLVNVECSDDLVGKVDVRVNGGVLVLAIKDSRLKMTKNSFLRAKVSMPELRGVDLSGSCKLNSTGSFNVGSSSFRLDLSGAAKVSGLDVKAGAGSFDLSGASNASMTGSFGNVGLDCSGASGMSLAADFATMVIDISGSSRLTLSGNGDTIKMDASGACTINFKSLNADRLTADMGGATNLKSDSISRIKVVSAQLSGAANAEVHVTEELSVDLSGASNFNYSKNKTVKLKNIRTSGAAHLNAR